ncbi:uncharacterized protein A4U43_C07F28660 [Asparagus officinalis]|uniref:Uncharacterized protein n=1 Tax=Asparagus officinalis TaxID=4686 RepID=A0A5P1EFL0_ASPOF|nr:uncharacterized protein A4U43_C07F28660 [Asparagus officinalis]
MGLEYNDMGGVLGRIAAVEEVAVAGRRDVGVLDSAWGYWSSLALKAADATGSYGTGGVVLGSDVDLGTGLWWSLADGVRGKHGGGAAAAEGLQAPD